MRASAYRGPDPDEPQRLYGQRPFHPADRQHWLGALDLDRSCLRAHTINHFPTSSSGKKRNRLPYGVCFIAVHSTRLVQHIFGAIQEYAGFEEPRWVDCDPLKEGEALQRSGRTSDG